MVGVEKARLGLKCAKNTHTHTQIYIYIYIFRVEIGKKLTHTHLYIFTNIYKNQEFFSTAKMGLEKVWPGL